MERQYEEKLESLRREMEMRNAHEKSKLELELEKLRTTSAMSIPRVSLEGELCLGSPGADNDPYNIMKSIAFEPVPPKRRSKSFNIKDITGERQLDSDGSTKRGLRFSRSPSPSPNLSPDPSPEPELPLLSPATGQHNTSATRQQEAPMSPDLKRILDTYELVPDGKTIGGMGNPRSASIEMSGSTPDVMASCAFDIGYVNRNMSRFTLDNDLSKSCPTHAIDTDTSTVPGNDIPDYQEPAQEPE